MMASAFFGVDIFIATAQEGKLVPLEALLRMTLSAGHC
jgi:hypothetical protein